MEEQNKGSQRNDDPERTHTDPISEQHNSNEKEDNESNIIESTIENSDESIVFDSSVDPELEPLDGTVTPEDLSEEILEIDFFKEDTSETQSEDTDIVDGSEYENSGDEDSTLSEEVKPIEPTIWLVKGEESLLHLSDVFQPSDLMNLVINTVNPSKFTYVKMIDSRDQVRYHAKLAGPYHKFTTRLQLTRTYGEWRLEVEVPLVDTSETKHYEIPFSLVEEVEDDDSLLVELIETEEGYLLEFLKDREEMFEVVDKDEFVLTVEEEIEEEIFDLEEIEAEDLGLDEVEDLGIDITDEEVDEVSVSEEIDTIVIPEQEEELVVTSADVEDDDVFTNTDLPDLKIPVNEIHGIGPAYRKKLAKVDIEFVHQLLPFTPETLAEVSTIKVNKSENWIAEARDIANNPDNRTYMEFKKEYKVMIAAEEVAELSPSEIENNQLNELNIPVSEIKGIGPSYQKKLATHEITFIHHLLGYTAETLSDLISVSTTTTAKWMKQVLSVANDPENEIYNQYLTETTAEVEEETEIKEQILETVEFANEDLVDLNIPITELSGIGPSYAKKFEAAGIKYIHHMLPYSFNELSEKSGLSSGRCEKWLDAARDVANNPENEIYKKYK